MSKLDGAIGTTAVEVKPRVRARRLTSAESERLLAIARVCLEVAQERREEREVADV